MIKYDKEQRHRRNKSTRISPLCSVILKLFFNSGTFVVRARFLTIDKQRNSKKFLNQINALIDTLIYGKLS